MVSSLPQRHLIIRHNTSAQNNKIDFHLDLIIQRAEIINITLALETTKYLSEEKEYIPWEAAIRHIENFFLMFDRSEVYGPLQVHIHIYRHTHIYIDIQYIDI